MQSSWPREEACRRPGKGTGVGGVTWKGDVFASPCPTCSAFSRSYPSFPSCPPHTSPIVTHATEHPGLTHCPQHAPHPVLQGMCPRNLAHFEPQLPPPANVHHCAAATGGSSGLKGKDGAEKRFSGLRIDQKEEVAHFSKHSKNKTLNLESCIQQNYPAVIKGKSRHSQKKNKRNCLKGWLMEVLEEKRNDKRRNFWNIRKEEQKE